MTDDAAGRAAALAKTLRDRGHDEASGHIEAAVAQHREGGLLEALREVCQTLLTAVEAVDPSSYAAIEEMRLDLDRRLDTGRTSG
jgi:hypothetical protein